MFTSAAARLAARTSGDATVAYSFAFAMAVERALEEPPIRARARELAAWAGSHDAGTSAALLVEDLATREPTMSA